MGKSFNFIQFYVFYRDPSRSELIRLGLAVRVDPVRLLYLPRWKHMGRQRMNYPRILLDKVSLGLPQSHDCRKRYGIHQR